MKQAKRTMVSHEKQVNVVRIAPNGKICASASHDKKIVVKYPQKSSMNQAIYPSGSPLKGIRGVSGTLLFLHLRRY